MSESCCTRALHKGGVPEVRGDGNDGTWYSGGVAANNHRQQRGGDPVPEHQLRCMGPEGSFPSLLSPGGIVLVNMFFCVDNSPICLPSKTTSAIHLLVIAASLAVVFSHQFSAPPPDLASENWPHADMFFFMKSLSRSKIQCHGAKQCFFSGLFLVSTFRSIFLRVKNRKRMALRMRGVWAPHLFAFFNLPAVPWAPCQ